MRRDEHPGPDDEGPDDESGPGDWNSGPWGPVEEPAGSVDDASATIAALRAQIRRRERRAPDGVGGVGDTGSTGDADSSGDVASSTGPGGFDLWGRDDTGRAAAGSGRRRQGRGRKRENRRAQDADREDQGAWEGREAAEALGDREAPGAPGGRAARGVREARRGRGARGERRERSGEWLPDGPGEGSAASEGPPADPEAVARAICLRLLTMAPKTRAQLADALRKRDVPEEAANAVLERFSEVGLIDDEAFAAAWVTSRHAGRGLARRALAQELRRRGVAEETVEGALERLDPDEETETARRLVERKLAGTRGVEPQARMRRLVGMLARKGYAPGLAFRIVREAIEAEGIPSDGLPDSFE
ncbi:recombination regulator RecX [Microbispora sp. NBC_01189]|uniref:recombination regulator RecX n=1 Tax=Microbispora sp. NBC_01189 TaxID=2903583 RepID=UPI002E14DFE5|nr:recombination regulator RecX [Microbispora sp. NBC_01189]